MKVYPFVIACIVSVLILSSCASNDDSSVLSGEYLGQDPPGSSAELFAPGLMSTEMSELNSVFFPGGHEVIYSVSVGLMRWALVMLKEENGRWGKPEIAPFSGLYGGVDPFVTQDGGRIYFCSNRPHSGEGEPESDYDIWYVDRTGTGWSEPVNMGPPINSESHEFYPVLALDGTFYFQSQREGGRGAADIWKSELQEGRYAAVECLPEPINSTGFEGDSYVAPDESYIIVSTMRKDINFGGPDLYISFREPADDSWGPLINMGESVNSDSGENCQILSPCGRYLFFTSRRLEKPDLDLLTNYEAIRRRWASPLNGGGNIYWVDAGIIDRIRETAR